MHKGKLEKIIPARRKVIEFQWIKKEFLVMGPGCRAVWSKMKVPMDKCDWCNNKFLDGETMGLAGPKMGRNMLLCGKCVDEAVSHE